MIKCFRIVEEYNEEKDIFRNIRKYFVFNSGRAIQVNNECFAEHVCKFNLRIKSKESAPDAEGFKTITTEYTPF